MKNKMVFNSLLELSEYFNIECFTYAYKTIDIQNIKRNYILESLSGVNDLKISAINLDKRYKPNNIENEINIITGSDLRNVYLVSNVEIQLISLFLAIPQLRIFYVKQGVKTTQLHKKQLKYYNNIISYLI